MSCSGGWLPSGGAAREEGIGEEVPLSGILGRSSCFSTQFPKVSGFFPVKKPPRPWPSSSSTQLRQKQVPQHGCSDGSRDFGTGGIQP